MRKLLPLAVLLATAGVRADEPVRAPVPKAPVPPAIDGKYTLLATSPTGKAASPWAKDGGPAGADRGENPFGTAVARSALVRGETVITRNEITIEPRTATGTPVVMEYTLDTTKTPIAIDAEQVSVKGKKTKLLGVVEVSGNRLTVALAKEGAERPKSVEEADGVTVYYFQKAPRTEYRVVTLKVGGEEKAEKELNDLAKEGFEVLSTSGPVGNPNGFGGGGAVPTTTHILLKRVVK